MEEMISEIRAVLRAGAFTIALQGTLACIDICAALSSVDGRTTRTHFKVWFETHLSDRYERFSPDDAYQLRCGMLHQGRASAAQYSAIVFTLPDAPGLLIHNNIMNDALNLDLVTFCNDVLTSAQIWWESSRDTEGTAQSLVVT